MGLDLSVTRRDFLATTTALWGSGMLRANERSGLRAHLLGTWRLVDAVTVYGTGATGPWYDRPGPYSGLLLYGVTGVMSVQIASARPRATSPPAFSAMAAAERLRYLDSYYAYFGRFDVDEAAAAVRHLVETSLDPTESGAIYTQRVSVTSDRLTLTTQPWRVHGESRHSLLTWARA